MLATTTSRREFPHTRWSLVQAANSLGSAAALEELCGAYWYPLYAYVRRCGYSAHDAQDLVQAFFCELLEKGWLSMADRERGKLRTFLIVAVRNFMAKEWRRLSAQRRGGARTHIPVDTVFAESRYAADPTAHANNVRQLVGSRAERLRVGDFRVIFEETETEIVVTKISPRGEVCG